MKNKNLNTMQTTAAKAPSVWQFTEAVQYLRQVYDYRKTRDQHFSYGTWAEQLGLKSRSFLRLVLVGKRRITEDTALLFSRFCNHDAMEKQYFLALVRLSRATRFAEKEAQALELTRLKQKFALKTHDIVEIQKADILDFLMSYKMPRLQTLLGLEGVKKNEKTLSQITGIKESEVASMLQTLEKLGLAEKDENQEWKSKENQIQTPEALGNVAVQSFHKRSLQEAVEALTLPPTLRCFQSLLVALTQEQYESLCQNIREFLQVTLSQHPATPASATQKVYQFNLNLIPVTGPTLRSMSATEASAGLNQEVENENKNN